MSSLLRLLLCSGLERESASALSATAAADVNVTPLPWSDPADDASCSDVLRVVQSDGVGHHASAAATAWQGSSLVRAFAAAKRVVRACDAGEPVVVDCGDLASFVSSVNDVHVLRHVAAGALRPELLMDEAGRDIHARVSTMLQIIDAFTSLVAQEGALRLAVRPESVTPPTLVDVLRDLSVVGLHVDGVVIAPVGKKRGRAEVRVLRRVLDEQAADIRVWRASRMRAAPKSAGTLDRLGSGQAVTTVLEYAGAQVGEYVGTCAAHFLDSADMRVGVQGEFLVLATSNVQRLLPLPSTLLRCRPVDAGVDAGGVHVHFRADASLWPESIYPVAVVDGDGHE